MITSPLTISELTGEIKSIVENKFRFVWLTGEISNFKSHSSGHYYFTLKDEKAQISANMWSSRNRFIRFTPENGMNVIVKGRITLYESKGSYQVDVYDMQNSGEGALQNNFEKLKQKLFAEGLFDQIHKKELPKFPQRVGIITSDTGAAFHDFIKITQKRFPIVSLYLINATMQGDGASRSVRNAIRRANDSNLNLEILVVTRGGGSAEDLLCFNDELLVREIFKSDIPVVSAIGHEIDFTICDFVADLRAPTPSAAAEMIFPDISEIIKRINDCDFELRTLVKQKFANAGAMLNNISRNYHFNRPGDIVNEYKYRLDENERQLTECVKENLIERKRNLDSFEKLLKSLGPEQVLKRGYSIVSKSEKIITRRSFLNSGDDINIKFYDGDTEATIN